MHFAKCILRNTIPLIRYFSYVTMNTVKFTFYLKQHIIFAEMRDSMALNKSTLSEQIYQILRDDILKQNIRCGEKLTLKLLMERFQVSSTPIREALTRLSQDHLVSYYSNIGVNVIDLKPKDLKEIYQFMGDLDGLAIRYASSYPRQEEVAEAVGQVIEQAANAVKKGDTASWCLYSDQFHLEFYKFCCNSHLAESAERMRSQLTIFSNQYGKNEEIQTEIQTEHEAIFQTYLDGDVEAAVQMMKAHLEHSLKHALALI